MLVPIKKLHPEAIIPKYAHEGDAGFDIHVLLDKAATTLAPNEARKFNSGLAMSIPKGYMLAIVPRSGLGSGRGLVIANLVGVVDQGYTGEVIVALWNRSDLIIPVNHLERVCQGIIVPVVQGQFVEVESLEESERGDGGFGSTDTVPVGTEDFCKSCRKPIVFKGPYWEHTTYSPRHPAFPGGVSDSR